MVISLKNVWLNKKEQQHLQQIATTTTEVQETCITLYHLSLYFSPD